MSFDIQYSIYTDAGGRGINEDSVGVYENGNSRCYILCDGLGGHGMGDIASSLVKEVFASRFAEYDHSQEFLKDTFSAAQDILMAEQIQQDVQQKMKTTAVCGITDDNKLYFGHIGDSRLYVFNKKGVMTRTLDHSIPQMLAIAKEIDESEIRNHPERNYVLRVLGVSWEEPMFEIRKPIHLRKCRAILLCSDGFWELIEETEMCRLLEDSSSVQEWLDRMVRIVKSNGFGKNMDNNSAIAVWVKKNDKKL